MGAAGLLIGSSTSGIGREAASAHPSSSTVTLDVAAGSGPCPVITMGFDATVQSVVTAVAVTAYAPQGRAGTLVSVAVPDVEGTVMKGVDCGRVLAGADAGSQGAGSQDTAGLIVPASGSASGTLVLNADCSARTLIVTARDGAGTSASDPNPTQVASWVAPDRRHATVTFTDRVTGKVQISQMAQSPALLRQFDAVAARCTGAMTSFPGTASSPNQTMTELIDVPLGASYPDPPQITQMGPMPVSESKSDPRAPTISSHTFSIMMRAPVRAGATLSLLKPLGSPLEVMTNDQALTVPPGAWRDFSVELFWPPGHCSNTDLISMQAIAAGGLQVQAVLLPDERPDTAVVLHSVPGWDQNVVASVLRDAYLAVCG